MTLADRLGLSDHGWYPPAAFVIGSFAVGMQLALIWQALGATPYPPPGKEILAWGSIVILAGLLVLQLPPSQATKDRVSGVLASVRERLAEANRDDAEAPGTPPAQPSGTNGHGTTPEAPAVQPAARLKIRVHSPLMVGPVVAPGETVPVQVHAEPEELARQLEVTFEVTHNDQPRTTTANMQGTDLVHTETFEDPGPFEILVQARHPKSEPASKRIEGRVATYREEVGRLFDQLKARAREAGAQVGEQSTPREVCKHLTTIANASYDDAEALRTHLEVALYGDAGVDRATYEAIHTIIREVGLETDPEEVQA